MTPTPQPEPKFTVGKGQTGGSKQLTFYHCGKVNMAELDEAIAKEFPDVPRNALNFFPGIAYCVVTTGKSLEVPPT